MPASLLDPEAVLDKLFIDEAVSELSTVNDMMRWAVSCFNEADLFYGHGTDNGWDEAVQLMLPSLHLPPFISDDIKAARLTRSERQLLAELVARRVEERLPAPYLTNKAWFAGLEFYVDERVIVPRRITSYNVCYTKLLRRWLETFTLGCFSAPRQTLAMALTVSTGKSPAAVSAESITASVPSSTALATS